MNEAALAAQTVDYDPFAGQGVLRVVPTTESQREIWLADQLGREASLAYNESASLVFEGAVDETALAAALQDLCDRHEALRATVGADGSDLWVAERIELPLTRLDLRDLTAAEADRAAAVQRLQAVETPFALSEGPLLRAVLIRRSANSHELILTAHHIICDGWSLGVLVNDLMTIYRARLEGAASSSAPVARFGDYALAQMTPEALRRQADDERYWVAVHDGAVSSLDLPADRPRAPVRSFASRREDLVLEAPLAKAVRELGAKNDASLFVTLFGLFGALMMRLSGQGDVVVGVPVAGQAADGFDELVGHCVNLLPIRLHAVTEHSASELLGTARAAMLDAYDHQQCTFGSLLKQLQITRDPARLPLVSVLFNLDASIPADRLSHAGLRVAVRGNPRSFENFELFLNVSQVDDTLVLECQYNTALFDAATVRRWLVLYRSALERCAAEPRVTLAQAFAPCAEDAALLATFNATAALHDRSRRVDELISQQAAATPDAVAIVAGDRHMSYRELERSACALALDLRRRGVGAGDLVGLSCGRNEHMLVALYGILKAGAGYVPLDPAFPIDRLEFMAEEAKLRVVATDGSVCGGWKFKTAQPVYVDLLAPIDEAVPSAGSVDDVAYVIFTSGSTGRPKGVCVPHRSVTNLLASVKRAPGMRPEHRVLSVTTLSFDIAVCEVIMPLTVGARIVVADRAQATDGERLRQLIEREHVNFIDATPSTWRLLLASGWAGRNDLLAICTGEPLPPDLGRELLPRVGELWNGYGPTETTVWSSFHKVGQIDAVVPIGRPIANTQFHVLDAALRPLPVGVVGELVIAGEGVTLGYLNRPDLTAERFLADPFATVPGARAYRTGDLGRWRADGVLECLGRIDHQVKVRGYRIELGEIEATLAEHAAVDRVLVVTREDRPGDTRIVAYVVPRGTPAEAAELRSHLARRLPEYMIPQHFVALREIPLLPNGKIDRKSLPLPAATQAAPSSDRAVPGNDIEAAVLRAIEEALSLPGLGMQDDFFALGGHSLLAARLTTRLNQDFGIRLPMRTLFESPTAQRLSIAVAAAREAGVAKREPIERRTHQASAPLTPMQERIRFIEELHPGRVLYNSPSAHRLVGTMDRGAFERALQAMVQRQGALRTSVHRSADGRGFEQFIAEHIVVDLPFVDLGSVPEPARGAELMRRMQQIVDTPQDIFNAPLFRAALYRLSDREHVFLFMPHHLIWDGWSFDLLYDEMAALYGGISGDRAEALPPLAVSYGDYAHWLDGWMGGADCEAQRRYWKKRFARAALPDALTTDEPRRRGMSGAGATELLEFDAALTEALHAVALDAGVTLNMLTMAVYTIMLAGAASTSSIVIGLPVRGRLMAEIEPVMGFFNNLLPVHLDVAPQRRLADFLGGVKRELLEVFSHQDIPFEALANEPEVALHSQRTGLYQALFSFQDARERKRRWGALAHSSIVLFQKGATEDLGLWLMQTAQGLNGGITYNIDLFHQATAAALAQRYGELLRRVASDPGVTVAALMAPGDSAAARVLQRLGARGVAPPTASPPSTASPGQTATMASPPPQLSEAELALATLWAPLLDIPVEEIGAHDNFFDLGGDSLRAMTAVEQSGRHLGLRVDARRYISDNLGQLAVKSDAAGANRARGKGQEPVSLMQRLFGRGERDKKSANR